MQSSAAPQSITELYDQFGRPAFSLARRIVRNDVLAENVLQDAFLSLWHERAAWDSSTGTFAGRLMSTVHHRAVDAVRRDPSSRRDRTAEAEVPVPAVDVDDPVCDRTVAERVRAALAALPATERRALALAYYSGFTQREIATLTETPLVTVRTRMRTGMGQLQNALRETTGDAMEGPTLADA